MQKHSDNSRISGKCESYNLSFHLVTFSSQIDKAVLLQDQSPSVYQGGVVNGFLTAKQFITPWTEQIPFLQNIDVQNTKRKNISWVFCLSLSVHTKSDFGIHPGANHTLHRTIWRVKKPSVLESVCRNWQPVVYVKFDVFLFA